MLTELQKIQVLSFASCFYLFKVITTLQSSQHSPQSLTLMYVTCAEVSRRGGSGALYSVDGVLPIHPRLKIAGLSYFAEFPLQIFPLYQSA